MPPKRRRADDGEETNAAAPTRTTRSSAKAIDGSSTAAVANKVANMTVSGVSDPLGSDVAKPPTKKPRTKGTTSKSKGSTGIKTSNVQGDELQRQSSKDISDKPVSIPKQEDIVTEVKPTPQVRPVTPPPPPTTTKNQPYSAAQSLQLFSTYAESDDANTIGPEGFERLCNDAAIPLDGSLPLILAWQLEAKEMGKITRAEWGKGTEHLKISSLALLSLAVTDLENLLILNKPPLTKNANKKDPYDRTAYWGYATDPQGAYQKFYTYCFALAKPEQARVIDMETSTALWSVVLAPQYPLMSQIIEFINQKGTYKATNKDLWNMMLEFCKTIKPSLSDYEADGAWPTLLDDFVSWKKESQ